MLVGIISAGIAIYQWTVMNENKKRRQEIQFALAGVGSLALSKVQAWNNQISLLPRRNSNEDLEICRVYSNARDDLMEVSSLTNALEGTIDSDFSASNALMEKGIRHAELNNKLQTISLQNPNLPQDQVLKKSISVTNKNPNEQKVSKIKQGPEGSKA